MKVVTILSGGMDSVTLLHALHSQGYYQQALHFFYGQKHKKEVAFADKACKKLGVPLIKVRLNLQYQEVPLMGDGEIPEGHYASETMKQTIVPNRNAIMLSHAWGLAVNMGAGSVAYAAHGGDHYIYPDCRLDFIRALQHALRLATETDIDILVPFIEMDKSEIVRIGTELGVDYSETWSCYNGRTHHCGKCGTCNERIEAFQKAEVVDPTIYEMEKE
jgi:7-cyano-7-deazaguanine synthase